MTLLSYKNIIKQISQVFNRRWVGIVGGPENFTNITVEEG